MSKVWLCDLTHTKQTIANDSMPLGVGLIATYCQKKLKESVDFKIFKFPEDLIENLFSCFQKPPKIIGFSNFVWNLDLSHSLASRIKKLYPQTVIVFGGPNYPLEKNAQKAFLKNNKVIDFYIYGEGEHAFYRLLTALIENNFDSNKVKKLSLENCHYLSAGNFVQGPLSKRIDLKKIPSPYLAGLMDKFFDGRLTPLIQTVRGCPYTCTYCSMSDPYYSKLSLRNITEVSKELEYIAKKIKGKNRQIFVADSNFGICERDLKVAKAIAMTKKKYGYPDYIHVAAAKDNKERVLKMAKITKGAFRLSASIQSADPEVLKNIKRVNVPIEDLVQLVREANPVGSNTYSEIILALPGDTKKAHFDSVKKMMNLDVNHVWVYTLMLLLGSEMTTNLTRRKFGLVSRFRVVPRCFGSYKFGDKIIHSVEIEEVCVANNTLSFKDYLDCRLLCLLSEFFYNDGVMLELITFLKQIGITAFDLVKEVYDSRNKFPVSLKKLCSVFLKDTKDELWNSKEEFEKFIKKKNIIKKYIDGKYGRNLIMTTKAFGFVNHTREIHDVAFDAAERLIKKQKKAVGKEVFKFLDDLKIYSLLKKKDIIDPNGDKVNFQEFGFNMKKIETNGFNLSEIYLASANNKTYHFKFYHDNKQAQNIKDCLEKFGNNSVGLSRIFARLHIKNMQKKVLKH